MLKIALPLGRKAITNQDSILKSRGITLPTKIHVVKTMFSFFCFLFFLSPSSHVWM